MTFEEALLLILLCIGFGIFMGWLLFGGRGNGDFQLGRVNKNSEWITKIVDMSNEYAIHSTKLAKQSNQMLPSNYHKAELLSAEARAYSEVAQRLSNLASKEVTAEITKL